jgi:hypothetical protein
MKNQSVLFGFFNDEYYSLCESQALIIPENVDYKTSSIQSQLYDSKNSCDVNIYRYHSDIVTECNSDRVAFMKEFLIDNKVTEISHVNQDYVVGVTYSLYNKDNKIISSGTRVVKAKFCTAIVNSPITETNMLEYRKLLILDGSLEINVPSISKYGIKNAYKQYPYTLSIEKIVAISTIGEPGFVLDDNTESHSHGIHHGHHVDYDIHRPAHIGYNNFSSKFLTNAHVGTTIIDHMICSAELQIPPEYTKATLYDEDVSSDKYIVKIDKKIDTININLEVVLDNINEVYDVKDIEKILELNAEEDDDVPTDVPDDGTDEPTDTPTDNPDDNVDGPTGTPDTGDIGTEDPSNPTDGEDEDKTDEPNTNDGE